MNEQLSAFLKQLIDKQVFWPLYVVIIVPVALQVLTALAILMEKIVKLVQRGKATELERTLVGMLDARLADMVKAHNGVGRVLGRLEAMLR